MLSGTLLIVIGSDIVAVIFVLSVTWKVTGVGPPAVRGVPEIIPPALSDSPAGKLPEDIVHV